MGRMEERMGAEIAMHRCKFDEAVQGLMDEASRLSTDDAAALTAAAKDQAHLFNAQGSEGAKDVAAGARRRSYVMARDAQVLRHLGAAGTPGGGDAAGGSHASAHADAPAGTPASSSDVRMVDESALIAARRQLAAVEASQRDGCLPHRCLLRSWRGGGGGRRRAPATSHRSTTSSLCPSSSSYSGRTGKKSTRACTVQTCAWISRSAADGHVCVDNSGIPGPGGTLCPLSVPLPHGAAASACIARHRQLAAAGRHTLARRGRG